MSERSASARLPWFRCFPSALLGAMAGLEADESLVYVTVLLRIYETGGPVHESGRTLARRTGLTERRAKCALEGLIVAGKIADLGDSVLDSASTHGEIEWQTARQNDQSSAGKASAAKRQKQAADKKNDTSALPDDADDAEKDKQNQQNGVNGRSTGDEQPRNHLEEDTEQFQKKPTVSPETRARESFPAKAFDQFWIRYPHKVGKHAAEASFDRTRKSGRVDFERLMTGLDRYIQSKPPDRPWCNPATWLNQGRYDDQPSTDDQTRTPASTSYRPSQPLLDPCLAAVGRYAARNGLEMGRRDGDRRREASDDPDILDADWRDARRA